MTFLGIPSRGQRNFNGCQNRRVTVKGKKLPESATLTCPQTELTGQDVTVNALGIDPRSRAGKTRLRALHSYRDPEVAKQHLGEVAAAFICSNCTFATMTPDQAHAETLRRVG